MRKLHFPWTGERWPSVWCGLPGAKRCWQELLLFLVDLLVLKFWCGVLAEIKSCLLASLLFCVCTLLHPRLFWVGFPCWVELPGTKSRSSTVSCAGYELSMSVILWSASPSSPQPLFSFFPGQPVVYQSRGVSVILLSFGLCYKIFTNWIRLSVSRKGTRMSQNAVRRRWQWIWGLG